MDGLPEERERTWRTRKTKRRERKRQEERNRDIYFEREKGEPEKRREEWREKERQEESTRQKHIDREIVCVSPKWDLQQVEEACELGDHQTLDAAV